MTRSPSSAVSLAIAASGKVATVEIGPGNSGAAMDAERDAAEQSSAD